jgi:hypothetical protein
MKGFIYTILSASFLGSHLVFAQVVPNCKLKDERVERPIAEKARQLQGAEYCQFRRYNSINDIEGDGKDDFVVIYTVEEVHRSMNHYLQFMLVFLSSKPRSKPLEIQVGERGKRSVDEIGLVGRNKIILGNDVWISGDALCCPSGKGKSVYEIQNGKIVKISEDGG